MQYLTRAILSSFLPRSAMSSRRGRMVLIVAGTIAIVVGVILLLHLGESPSDSVQSTLGVKPLYASDANGAKWTIEPAVGQPFARLRESQIEPGAPLTIRTDVYRHGGRKVSIGLTIEGRAGERYRPDITKDGTLVPAPTFAIVDEAGRAVFQGKFKYG